jgi:hypothetical protein
MPQAGRSRVRFQMKSLNFSIDLILPGATMALGSTRPPTEMSTRNLPGGKGRPARKIETSPPFVSRLSNKCGSLDLSQRYGPPQSATGIALPLPEY